MMGGKRLIKNIIFAATPGFNVRNMNGWLRQQYLYVYKTYSGWYFWLLYSCLTTEIVKHTDKYKLILRINERTY